MGIIALVLSIFIITTDRRVASVDEVIAKVVPKSLRDDPLFYRTIGSGQDAQAVAPESTIELDERGADRQQPHDGHRRAVRAMRSATAHASVPRADAVGVDPPA